MDQLTAYRILGLQPGCSPEEVKEAYAALSKKYHPEEEPEKFQEIHEAYVTLTRRKRRGSVQSVYQEQHEIEETPKIEFDFQKVEMERNKPKEETYSFEEAMQKAKAEEQVKSHELVLEAAAELRVLVSPKYKNNLKAYKTFFEDKKYAAIIRRTDFLEKLCDILEESKLSKPVYNYIIEFYRLRGRKQSELSQVGLRLYQILDGKVGMKPPVNPGIYGGVVAGILAGIRAIRPIARNSQFVAVICFCVIAALLLIWVCKKLRENRSALLAQAVIAIGIAISQFVVIMFDLYGTAFGTVDDGNSIAAMIFLAAVAWLIGVVLVAIVKFIVGLFRKK